jgi:hypothetical protein
MIKTTNYEISKKLAEIGFRAECSYFYFHSDNNNYEASSLEAFGYDEISDCDIEDKYYPAYDLEILLNALPDDIKYKNEYYYYFLWGNTLGYYYENSEYQDNYHMGDGIFEFSKLSLNKSLADTAGRLIILLHEKNLIKF